MDLLAHQREERKLEKRFDQVGRIIERSPSRTKRSEFSLRELRKSKARDVGGWQGEISKASKARWQIPCPKNKDESLHEEFGSESWHEARAPTASQSN